MKINDVIEFKNTVYPDERGFFMEIFRDSNDICRHVVQENASCSNKYVIRGLHYQTGMYAQGKFVQVLQGSLYDMIVDLRIDSSTYGNHMIVKLDTTNSLWVPRGCAHGIFIVQDNTIFLYRCDNTYNKAHETGLRWDDPKFTFKYTIGDQVIINERDQTWPLFNDCIKYE